MKNIKLALTALLAFTGFAGSSARADNVASIAIPPATGVVTLTPRGAIGGPPIVFDQPPSGNAIGRMGAPLAARSFRDAPIKAKT